MRILIPVIGFDRSGGYRVLSELASHWQDMGHPTDFLVDQRYPQPYFATRAGIRWHDRNGLEVQAAQRRGSFRPRGNAVSIHLGLWRGLRRLAPEYDIVLANHSLTALSVAFGARPRTGHNGRCYYIQAYEPGYFATLPGWKARVLQAMAWLSYRLPLRQIANAPLFVGHRGIRATEWIPPGLDLARFRRRDTARCADQDWTLGTIARREPPRGTPQALAAFVALADRHPTLRMRVAYANLPSDFSHPRVEIIEPRDDDELADYYRSLDALLALPQLQIGAFHYPVLEAMASGIAVVTTGSFPACADNAWIAPAGDSAAVARTVETLMATPAAERAARIERAAEAVRVFAWPVVAERFLRWFEQHPTEVTPRS